MITVKDLQIDEEIQTLYKMSDTQLENMGYTEHSERHRLIVCRRIEKILEACGASDYEINLAQLAGYMHDIGCSVNRHNHAHYSGVIAYNLLKERGLNFEEASIVMNAVANHDEKTGFPCTKASAALILADKSDVHRNRVRRQKINDEGKLLATDIHDRVNYSVIESRLDIDTENKIIFFRFELDDAVSSAMEYFEIFLGRMKMCKNAAIVLGFEFKLEINQQILA